MSSYPIRVSRIDHDDHGNPRWAVLVDGAVIGMVTNRATGLRSQSRISPDGPHWQRQGALWYGSVEGIDLDPIDRTRIEQRLTSGKTNRHAAGALILDAYNAAGVPLPTPDDDT